MTGEHAIRMTETIDICPCCGEPVRGFGREIRMALPDDIFEVPAGERDARVRQLADDFISLDARRFFVPALLPVVLTTGHEFHFGTWVEVSETDARSLGEIWSQPEYLELEMPGRLANALEPWGAAIADATCTIRAVDPDALPYIGVPAAPALERVLRQPWSADECLREIEKFWGPATAN